MLTIKKWAIALSLFFTGIVSGLFINESKMVLPTLKKSNDSVVILNENNINNVNTIPATNGKIYTISTKALSFFARDINGLLIPELNKGKKTFVSGENEFHFQRLIHTNSTALIVMDPWVDTGSTFLNEYFKPVFNKKILPLVHKAIELKIPIIVLTNDPQKNTVDYGSVVFEDLIKLEKNGNLKIIYHQDYNDESFSKYLKSKNIDSLIYSGFASNMCVIGRELGMIPMQTHGFKLYFIPDASAAVEYKESWQTGVVHKATTQIISQWVGELIDLKSFLELK